MAEYPGEKFTGTGAGMEGCGGETGTERLMTVKELADLTRLSVGTVQHWVAAGKVPVVRFGSRTLFRPSEIAGWIKQHSCPSAGAAVKNAERRAEKREAGEADLFRGGVEK